MSTSQESLEARLALVARTNLLRVMRQTQDDLRKQWGHISAASAAISRIDAIADPEVRAFAIRLNFDAVEQMRSCVVEIARLDVELDKLERIIRVGDAASTWQQLRLEQQVGK